MKRLACLVLIGLALSGADIVKLIPEEFVVKAGAVRFWRFNFTNPGRVFGRFRAQGGTGNDIVVIIADWDECENWINGNGAHAPYHSGKVTNGKMDIELERGDYCIAFNNKMSAVSAKEIQASIFRTEYAQ